MGKVAVFSALGAAVAAALGVASYMELGPFGSSLTKICEATLKDRLRSPAGYRRVAVDERQEPVTLGEYRAIEYQRNIDPAARDRLERMVDRWRREGRKPVRYVQSIDYDAPNAFGALIRGTAECEYLSVSGDLSGMSLVDVRVDGETSLEFLVRRLREAKNG